MRLASDKYLTVCYLAFLFLGWIMVYSTSGADDWGGLTSLDFSSYYGKQKLWIIMSLVLFFVIQQIPKRIWGSLSWLFYIFTSLALLAVLLVGSDVKGAQSWLRIGGISIQPSEFAKLSLFLVLSTFLSNVAINVKNLYNRFSANALIMIPLGLVLLQPDAGSAIVFLSCFLVLYREGYSPVMLILTSTVLLIFILTLKFNYMLVMHIIIFLMNIVWLRNVKERQHWLLIYIIFSFCSVAAARYGYSLEILIVHAVFSLLIGSYLIVRQKDHSLVSSTALMTIIFSLLAMSINYVFDQFLKPHQQARISVWLNPSQGDPQGSLYNLLQSKKAIGSGGLTGRGYLQGNMTKLNYIPEQNTDFIFSSIAEQFGFLGSLFVILLFLATLLRLLYLAENQKSQFNRIFMLCVSCCIFSHFFINIGMTMGLVPIIGIPMPFISYGGTALLSFTAMLAIACALDDTKDRKKQQASYT